MSPLALDLDSAVYRCCCWIWQRDVHRSMVAERGHFWAALSLLSLQIGLVQIPATCHFVFPAGDSGHPGLSAERWDLHSLLWQMLRASTNHQGGSIDLRDGPKGAPGFCVRTLRNIIQSHVTRTCRGYRVLRKNPKAHHTTIISNRPLEATALCVRTQRNRIMQLASYTEL